MPIVTAYYDSPIGKLLTAADGDAITGLWFVGQKYFAASLPSDAVPGQSRLLEECRRWLDIYFTGEKPDFTVPVKMSGSAFQNSVWKALTEIPYGKTVSYGELAAAIAAGRGLEKMSARAVGSAVGKNPVSILIPCHRVLGADGSLTGYAGGLEKKAALLRLEKTGNPCGESRF